MRFVISLGLLLVLSVGACHANILIPGREYENSAVRSCSGGVCMPLHPLEIYVGSSISQEVRITLLNPHGDDEDCDDREDGDRRISSCAYRVVRGFSAPYYFLVVVSPARNAQAATCAVDSARMLVHRLDRYIRFCVERVRLPADDGICIYVVRERPE